MSKHEGTYTQQDIRDQIISAMESVAGLKAILGEKKFNKRIKKASKIVAQGFPKKIKTLKPKNKKLAEPAD
jgi:hypothetical protein